MGIGAPELAAQLGIDPKDLRKWLRARYGSPQGSRWDLSINQVDAVKLALTRGNLHTGISTRTITRRDPSVPSGLPSYAYKVFPSNILKQAVELKANPVSKILQSGSKTLVFYPIVHSQVRERRSGRGSHRVGLAGNGSFLSNESSHDGFIKVNGEYLDTNFCYCPGPRQSPGTANEVVSKMFHKLYIEDLNRLEVPPHLEDIVLPDVAYERDTPQLIVTNYFAKFFQDRLSVRNFFLLSAILKKPTEELMLVDLFSTPPGQFTNSSANYHYNRYNQDTYDVGPIVAYLATINLFKVIPTVSEEFRITLREIYHRFAFEPDIKATKLREEVAKRYGFARKKDKWVKFDPDGHSWDNQPAVEISDDLKVNIQGRYTCIVSGVSTNLPYEDEVVRRMICVATKMRDMIYTIGPDKRSYLERVFGREVEHE